jgi:hypothetical protein
MWNVDQIEVVSVELDFSSSGQGRRSGTVIKADGTYLFNALEYTDAEASATQVEVCECCGVPHCQSGGWVAFRRLGDSVVWIPVWSEMEKDEWHRTEYSPPSFFHARGAPVITPTVWQQLRGLHGALPTSMDLPRLDSREMVRYIQWSAPDRVLGQFPDEPRLRRDLLVAVAEGDLSEETAFVDAALHANFTQPVPLDLLRPGEVLRRIEFFLDMPGTPAWTSFAHVQDDSCIIIDGGMALCRHG